MKVKGSVTVNLGFSIKPTIGIGDQVQFSSLPENYFKATGQKLIDVSKPWFMDFNPYVLRDVDPSKVIECWNFGPRKWEFKVPEGRELPIYTSNAEIIATAFGVPAFLNRPRLYRFENLGDFDFYRRKTILLQTQGRSHGEMPEHVLDHIFEKYTARDHSLCHIGPDFDRVLKRYGIGRVYHYDTPTLWDLAGLIAHARMLIGLDSGPSWIAAAYPDVIVKKVRTRPASVQEFRNWIPLAKDNIHSHWDDRCHMIFNPTTEDVGFTSSYLKI